ncbi:MAG: hypothetical protein EA391_06350 [Balneolaceae bacterium]|nr:MAG: hypothetical protein EA391_06350 [Balneolaceae bacterium]
MNIYIPIEIKVRELEGRTLLAFAAAERGHTVIVGEKKDTIGLATKGLLPPGLVHLKSITPHHSMKKMLTKLKSRGHSLTVQDEESGLLDETYETFARLRFSSETIDQVDKVLTWGNYDYRSLKKFYTDQSGKFVVTGSPRADFWRKDFYDYYSEHEESKTLDGKPYIMVVSNFGGILNMNRFWNIMARLNEAGYFEREEGRERHEFNNAAYQTRLIGEFVFMVRDLAKRFPDYNVLIRPHPIESVEGWEKLVGNVPGVYIKREGTISPWIRNAKLIIHNGCTSALEAAVGGQHRIAYRPLPNEIERAIPNKVSYNVFSMEELYKAVEAVIHNSGSKEIEKQYKEGRKIVNDRFEETDDKLAADKIVDQWESISAVADSRSESPETFLNVKQEDGLLKKSLKYGYSTIRKLTSGKKADENEKLLNTAFKFPEYTDEEFTNIREGLQKNLNRFKNVEFKRFGKKSFILYRGK